MGITSSGGTSLAKSSLCLGDAPPLPQFASVPSLEAQLRLRELGGSAPRWQRTASYCEAFPPPLTGEDVRERYRKTAGEYSLVLGRTITAEQLAPLVPGLRCEWKSATR